MVAPPRNVFRMSSFGDQVLKFHPYRSTLCLRGTSPIAEQAKCQKSHPKYPRSKSPETISISHSLGFSSQGFCVKKTKRPTPIVPFE